MEFIHAARRRLPLLESIKLQCDGSKSDSIDEWTDTFSDAPALKHVDWEDRYSFDIPFNLPWAQLTEVGVGICYFYECLKLLTLCPNVRAMRFWLDSIRAGTPLEPPASIPFLHQNLEALRCDYRTLPEMRDETILSVLTLPRLRSLTLGPTNPEVWIPHIFRSFLQRSGCTLRTLRIHSGLVLPKCLIACLAELSPVEELIFGTLQLGFSRDENFFGRLIRSEEGDATILPKLRLFYITSPLRHGFTDSGSADADPEAGLIKMIDSRLPITGAVDSTSFVALRDIHVPHTSQYSKVRECYPRWQAAGVSTNRSADVALLEIGGS